MASVLAPLPLLDLVPFVGHASTPPAKPAASQTPLRVLALRSVDGPGGGAEAILLRTAARINPDRVQMTICCIHRTSDEAYDFDQRAAALGIEYCGIKQRSIMACGVLDTLRRVVRERCATIVDAHDYKAAWFAYQLARLEGILPVSTLHGWSGHHWREQLVYYPAEKFLASRFPLVIAVSSEIRDTMLHWRSRPECVRVLLNGIDPAQFRRVPGTAERVRASLGIAQSDFVVGAVGRVEIEKRFDVLLEAIAGALSRRPELRLVLVGEGTLKHRLQDQARRLGIASRCKFLGHRRDMLDLYHAFDLFVQSSDHEGSPTVLVEAMAMELPVVATAVGGTREMIEHGLHGLLVPRRNPAALAAAIGETLAAPATTARRVVAARARAENELSFDHRTRRLEDMYWELATGCVLERRANRMPRFA